MKSDLKHSLYCVALWALPVLAWAQPSPSSPVHGNLIHMDGKTASRSMPSGAAPRQAEPTERSLMQWLLRIHEASRSRAYVGTFVVSTADGAMSSSRIWHVCDGEQQVERIDALTGEPRSTFRHNDRVVTFFPGSRLVQTERRQSLRSFPDVVANQDVSIAEHYTVRPGGTDRVAGLETQVLLIEPRDRWRFGYRIWSERQTGLMVKMQTLDSAAHPLEQSAFSELQLNASIHKEQLLGMMRNTQGYQVQKHDPVQTTAAAEGWVLGPVAAGFHLTSCSRQVAQPNQTQSASMHGSRAAPASVQWTFSDGLASVSLFVEPLEGRQGMQEVALSMGATGLLSRRVQDWWLTVVGEVPRHTLQVFSQSLQRVR